MSSEETQTISSWMDSDYFKSILIKYEGRDDLMLKQFNVKSGANKGENFASAIYRVTLNYSLADQNKETTFILKTSSESSAVSEFLDNWGTMAGEANIFLNILPECEKLIKGLNIAPRLIHIDKHAIVLEDLLVKNFKLADRKVRFDLNRAKIVIKKLAKFHAATAAIHKKDPKTMESYLNSAICSEAAAPIHFFFAVSMEETLETIRGVPELESFVKYLEDFDMVENEKKVFTRSPEDSFHVLNHGDLWINNIFFSFDDDAKPIDTVLVDYQECFWGSPGIDLNHFLFSSCDFDVHEKHFEELLTLYHQQLSSTLLDLNFSPIPSLENIRDEVARKSDQALIVLTSIVPVMMIENSDYANPANFISDDGEAATIRREVYGNPKFVELLKKFLPIVAKKK